VKTRPPSPGLLIAALALAMLSSYACQPTPEELQATVTRIAADVLATRAALPTPTATPPPFTVYLGPGGAGDYSSLEDAVRNAPDEATIVLDAGTYEVKETLGLNRPLMLQGAGMDATVISGAGLAVLARFSAEGRFGAQGITFRIEGEQASDVVVADGGEAYFANCRFTGASGPRGEAGAGLKLVGHTAGTVRDSIADDNRVGIRVTDQANPTVEWNLATDNLQTGILYEDGASGTAARNECSNGGTGIVVSDQAFPTLQRNLCTDNSVSGIAYRGNGGGIATRNECVWNGVHGITVSDAARPNLERNLCTDSSGAGVFYKDDAGGSASENACHSNVYGIEVAGNADPELRKNVCAVNRQAGILYADQSSGLAYRNECHDNGQYGIWVDVTAAPLLDDNVLYDNLEQDLFDQRP
jgi:parallel beta-helix repeat protein